MDLLKFVKKAGAIAVFLGLFLLCGKGLRYLLIDDTRSYTRLMLHDFYRQENIDILFAGSSHCYTALDPGITDQVFGKNTFNAGSSLQAQDASFALIREAVERYRVEHIYLEMYYLMMSNDDYKDREQLTGTYIISDYMRPSLNKLRFLLQASSPKYYVNSFIPARRNWETLLHPGEVRSIAESKSTESYREFQPFAGYRTKGFVINREGIAGRTLLDTAGFDAIHVEKASADWLKTIREIIAYCGKKNVGLTLFSAPMTLFQTAGVGNYDAYIDLVRDLTKGTAADYVDFNLCREEYFDQTPDLFSDAGHLNQAGAEAFSWVFGDYFTGKIGYDDLFYASMAEKIAAHGPDILGLSYLDSGDGMRKLKIVSTFPEGTPFFVEFLRTDGGSEILKDNDPDIFFEIPQSEHGTVRIRAEDAAAEIGV